MGKGSLMDRIRSIASSNAHAALDKLENPEKMLEQNMREAIEKLADLKEAAVELNADMTAAQRNYDAAVRKMQAEHGFAVNAMKAGNEEAAAKFLQSEASIKATEVDPTQRSLEQAKANYATVQQAYNTLAEEINQMKNQMNTIKGTIRTAKATEKVAAMQDDNTGYSASFSKYAEQAQHMLDVANAKIHMNTQPTDELSALRTQYAGGMEPDMSAKLAELKTEIGPDDRGVNPGNAEDLSKKAVEAMDDALKALRTEAGTN